MTTLYAALLLLFWLLYGLWTRRRYPRAGEMSEDWMRERERDHVMSRIEYHGPRVNWRKFSERFDK